MAKEPSRWMQRASELLAQKLTAHRTTTRSRRRTALLAAFIFILAVGVRLLQWQDLHVEIEYGDVPLRDLVTAYEREAHSAAGLFAPPKADERGDARGVIHPPGYSMLIRLLSEDNERSELRRRLRGLQMLGDAGAAVLLFLIASSLLPTGAAAIAGALVALSPHLTYYSLALSPDSLSVVPVLAAVLVLTRALVRPRITTLIAVGVLTGLSCWLRSNALLMAPFLAAATVALLDRGRSLRCGAALVCGALIAIAPVTLRNWAAYRQFIPLSIGAGITLIEGIADYDDAGRFGMPRFDTDARLKDAEWHGNPEYAQNLWTPDGVMRDRARFSRGLEVVRLNPGWFATVMLRRAGFMLRYNDSGPTEWPLGTSQVPIASKTAGYGSSVRLTENAQPILMKTPAELLSQLEQQSADARINLAADGSALLVSGDGSQFGVQFASSPLEVKAGTDYIARSRLRAGQAAVALKMTDASASITLGAAIVEPASAKPERRKTKKPLPPADPSQSPEDGIEEDWVRLELPFASGNGTQVRLALVNDRREPGAAPIVAIQKLELFEVGPTPNKQLDGFRAVVRGLQRNLFTTSVMPSLWLAGILLLMLAREWRPVLVLISVPLYYLCVQSVLHTEYRYIIAIHYFLFGLAGLTLYVIASTLADVVRKGLAARSRGSSKRDQAPG
jgi:hypothetical protein